MPDLDVAQIRRNFPALDRQVAGRPVAFFDGPAGSQVPQSVADAIGQALLSTNANRGGPFETSRESDALLDRANQSAACFLGLPDQAPIVFGPNMTSLTYRLSRALAQAWSAGDEVIVTDLDHDANVTPWVTAAERAGCSVKKIPVRLDDCTLDLDAFRSMLSERTRLVAVGYASNITGTVNPVQQMAAQAHAVGAEVFVDAVHFAPHRLIDIPDLNCDYLACSAYKFFGPHVGLLWGRAERMQELSADCLRPAPQDYPGKWMTGTQNHEGIIGVCAAIDYLATLGGSNTGNLRDRLRANFVAIEQHERQLSSQLLTGLAALPQFRIWGITDTNRADERLPTISITHDKYRPAEMAAQLAEAGIFTWPGNHYALPFTQAAGLEPDGTLRVGFLHYNTTDEVDRLLDELSRFE